MEVVIECVKANEEGLKPTTLVHDTPTVPESHCKLYEITEDPPLEGAVVNATQSISSMLLEVRAPEVGAAI